MKQLIDLLIASVTVAMEAGGEPRAGKLAVAYVLANRVRSGNRSMTDVMLQPQQFSCWNTDSPTRLNLDQATDQQWATCFGCALAAMFGLEPDPTGGAVFYLNKKVVLASAGKLPNWWEIDGSPESEVIIGNHAFRRHR